MKWLFYLIVFVYMFYKAVYGKSENGLSVDPIDYGEESFLKVGEHLTINCKPSNKNQKLEWVYPDGTVVKRIPGNRIFSQEHYVSGSRRNPALVMTITKAEVHDTGVYQCRSGDITKNVSLCVIEPSEFVDTSAEIIADIGRSITLSCQAKGNPEPRLVWIRNGETISDEGDSEKYKVMMKYNIQGFEGLLTVTSLQPDDSGVYSCVSLQENPLGEGCTATKTSNITLNVKFAPIFEGDNETNVYAKNNQQVEIVCSAEGYPAPTYRFLKELDDSLLEFDNKQIKYSEDNSEATLTVVASSSTLRHRFICQAKNELGSAEKYFTLLKTERPSDIDEVAFKPNDKSIEFNITWYEEVMFPVAAIEIQYIKDNNPNKKKVYLKDSAWRKSTQADVKFDDDSFQSKFGGTVTLPDLDEETSYWIRLRATNDVGVSEWSDPVFVSTLAEEEVIVDTEEPPEPESSVIDTEATDATFYGIFFAGGIFIVAFVCMFAMRMVK